MFAFCCCGCFATCRAGLPCYGVLPWRCFRSWRSTWPRGHTSKARGLREMSRPSGSTRFRRLPPRPAPCPDAAPGPNAQLARRRAERIRPQAAIARPSHRRACPCSLLRGTGRKACRAPPNTTRPPEFPGTAPVPPEIRIAQRRHGLPDATLPFHLGPTDPLQPCARALPPPGRGVFHR